MIHHLIHLGHHHGFGCAWRVLFWNLTHHHHVSSLTCEKIHP